MDAFSPTYPFVEKERTTSPKWIWYSSRATIVRHRNLPEIGKTTLVLKLYPNVDAAADFLMERKKIHKLDEQSDEESDSQFDVDKSSDESGKNP